MTFHNKKPEQSPGFLLWQITNTWQRQQRDALKKLNLTHPQFVVLAGILWLSEESENIITQQQVSDFTNIDKMSMSELVTTLITKKMLKREKHVLDKRAYSLSLTKKGYDLAVKTIPIVDAIDKTFFNDKNQDLMRLINLMDVK